MADIDFIVLKINGVDISEMPHGDAVQMFLNAPEPMTLEVRRPKSSDVDKYHINSAYIPPVGPVISSSASSPSLQSSYLSSQYQQKQQNKSRTQPDSPVLLSSSVGTTPINRAPIECLRGLVRSGNNDAGNGSGVESEKSSQTSVADLLLSPSLSSVTQRGLVSTGIQTDTVITEYIFSDASLDDQSNEHIFDEGLPPEIDIEEVTLQKSASNEKLGLTVSYSSGSDDTDTCTEVYISDIIPNSLAARDGRLRQGDQILQVNGRDVSSKEDTETLIAENKNAVTFLVSRYMYMDDEMHTSYDDYDLELAPQTYQNCLSPPAKQPGDVVWPSDQTNTTTSKSSSSQKSTNAAVDRNLASAKDIRANLLLDPLSHLNIEAHLESVNQEIAQLTSRMQNSMMLHNSSVTKLSKESKINNADATLMSSSQLQKQAQSSSYIYRAPVDNVSAPLPGDSVISPGISESPANNGSSVAANVKATGKLVCNRGHMDSDTEHIYETIPEEIETEPFYCLPYESTERNLVERWLEMQHYQRQLLLQQQQCAASDDTPTRASSMRVNRKDVGGVLLQQIKSMSNSNKFQPSGSLKTMKSNSSGEDHENSSSAYNTGGSCNSNNVLTLELNSNEDGAYDKAAFQRANPTLKATMPPHALQQQQQQQYPDEIIGTFVQDINDNCEECQRQKKEKTVGSPKHEQQKSPQKLPFSQRLISQTKHFATSLPVSHAGMQRSIDPSSEKSPEISADTMYTNMANLKRTMLLQQKLFRQALIRQNVGLANNSPTSTATKTSPSADRLHFTAPNLSQYHFVSSQEVSTVQPKPITCDEPTMVWKVKRRQDGTRYIVRRPARNRILRERAIRLTTERNDQTTEDDTISEIKTGRYWTREERKKHIERAKERRMRQQQQQLASINRSGDTLDNTLPIGATPTAISSTSAIRKPQQAPRNVCGQPTIPGGAASSGNNVVPNNASLNRTSALGGAVNPANPNIECPTMHKKSMKKKKKDENSTNVMGDNGSKVVGLLSVTTV